MVSNIERGFESLLASMEKALKDADASQWATELVPEKNVLTRQQKWLEAVLTGSKSHLEYVKKAVLSDLTAAKKAKNAQNLAQEKSAQERLKKGAAVWADCVPVPVLSANRSLGRIVLDVQAFHSLCPQARHCDFE